jgi:glycine cleavage system H protein
VKAVEDMYAPLSGEVVQRNEAVLASPEELQNDPHGEGWLLVIRPADASQLAELMDAATYTTKIAAS